MSEQQIHICKNSECSSEFRIIPQEEKFYENKQIPKPDFCPSCRHRQRMALRSERQLYRRTCGKCQKKILSTYPEDSPYEIYCQECFWENIN